MQIISHFSASALLSLVFATAILFFMLTFAFVSWREEEIPAAKRATGVAFLLSSPFFAAVFISFTYQSILCTLLNSITLTALLVLIISPLFNRKYKDETPKTQIDERDIMFSRKELVPGTQEFENYYTQYPQRKSLDDQFRDLPGLLNKDASLYDPITFAAAAASFKTVKAFHPLLENENISKNPQFINPEKISSFIKTWLKGLGAVSVGITKLKEYHLYSTIGRGEKYGEPVTLDHTYTIAFTVEMDKYFLNRAPKGPTLMESAQKYLNAGTLAVQLAEFIRELGYSARAHIDGNYRVVCPLVARDAGLGEIGRMGLLMTPELGPRVRIAVVTSDLPMIITPRVPDFTVIDFCRLCKKCAHICPSQAIPLEDRQNIDDVNCWQINSEACYTYWCKIGTDCARCMSVCPYSHPNNFLHNMMRFGVRYSRLFRKIALKLDDIIYGSKPSPKTTPKWIEHL